MNVQAAARPLKFLDRDHSILAFNSRVLDWARRSDVPLLERLRYLCIVSSNLNHAVTFIVLAIRKQPTGAPLQRRCFFQHNPNYVAISTTPRRILYPCLANVIACLLLTRDKSLFAVTENSFMYSDTRTFL